MAPDVPFYLAAAAWFGRVWLCELESFGPMVCGSAFDWHLRWAAPVSYWNPRWHGLKFRRVELMADFVWDLAWLRLALVRRLAQVRTPEVARVAVDPRSSDRE